MADKTNPTEYLAESSPGTSVPEAGEAAREAAAQRAPSLEKLSAGLTDAVRRSMANSAGTPAGSAAAQRASESEGTAGNSAKAQRAPESEGTAGNSAKAQRALESEGTAGNAAKVQRVPEPEGTAGVFAKNQRGTENAGSAQEPPLLRVERDVVSSARAQALEDAADPAGGAVRSSGKAARTSSAGQKEKRPRLSGLAAIGKLTGRKKTADQEDEKQIKQDESKSFLAKSKRGKPAQRKPVNKKPARKKAESDEAMPEDLREIRRRRQAERNQNRVRKVRRMLLILAVLAAVLVIVLAASLIRKHRTKTGRRARSGASAEADGAQTFSGMDVLHISFPRLVMSPSGTAGANQLTVEEFQSLLEDLYARDYVLVNLTSLAERDESGLFQISRITVPEGKKPLVISQRGLSYSDEDAAGGYATGIELSGEGKLTNLYLDANGGTRTGNCDVITCVNAFLEDHPDFSADGARGILAVTGVNGLLGYDNPQSAEAQEVVNELLEEGWQFASGSYYGVSYGTEQSIFADDVNRWHSEIADALGHTEIIVLPGRADIGNRSPYTEENHKFQTLSDQGFRYYCIDDSAGFTWMQAGQGFVRESMHEVSSYGQYLALMDNGMESFVSIRASEEKAAATEAEAEEEDTSGEESGQEGQNDQNNRDEQEDDGEVEIIHEDPI